MQQLVTQENG